MARSYAQVGTSLWTEPTIRQHTRDAQRAYLLVTTQAELSRCGVLPFRLKRLANMASDDTPKLLRKAITQLEKTRHLIVDETAEELLVRTYVRHDGLLAQPQVVAAMVQDYQLIESPSIRTAFLAELRRIWDLPDLPDNQRKGLRLALGEHETDRYLEKIGTGLATQMHAAIQEGSAPPFDPASPQGCPAPFEQAGTKAHAGARAPSPATTTPPAPTPAPSAASPATLVPAVRNGRHLSPADDTTTALAHPTRTLALLDQTGPYVPAIRASLATEVDQLLTADIPEPAITAALGVWRTRKAGPRLLAHLVQDQLTPAQQQDPRFAGLLADARSST